MSHDENFKNLITSYPRQALAFFAPAECGDLPADARLEFVRQEQPSPELGNGFRVLDTPVRITFPGGERKEIAVLLEEETRPRHFSIRRLARYAIDLSESLDSDRIVPVVIFLHKGAAPADWRLGTERDTYLQFRYVTLHLSQLRASDFIHSDNIAAVLNLPNMAHPRSEHVDVCLKALEGLARLEGDPHRQRKFTGYVAQYCGFTPEERVEFKAQIARSERGAQMSTFLDDYVAQGRVEGRVEGRAEGKVEGRVEGKAESVMQVLSARGLRLTPKQRAHVMSCTDSVLLNKWIKKAVTADAVGDIFDEKPLKH